MTIAGRHDQESSQLAGDNRPQPSAWRRCAGDRRVRIAAPYPLALWHERHSVSSELRLASYLGRPTSCPLGRALRGYLGFPVSTSGCALLRATCLVQCALCPAPDRPARDATVLSPRVCTLADDLIEQIKRARTLLGADIREGLAHTLAEAGLLPMFGMPTRVRNLYIDLVEDEEDEHQQTWSVIDRDLDLAIYEFAPDSVIVKDKQQHRAIGFTGPLEDPFRPGSANNPKSIIQYQPALSDPFWLIQCENCGSWHRYDTKPVGLECKCGYLLRDDIAGECRTPGGFRTDLSPRLINDNDSFGSRHRSITAEYEPLAFM